VDYGYTITLICDDPDADSSEQVHGGHITFSGDALPSSGEDALVIANHQAWPDFFLVHSVAIRAQKLHDCKYILTA
jgi:hypothetical protein